MPEIPENPKRPRESLRPYIIAFLVFDALTIGGFLAWTFIRPQPQPSTPDAQNAASLAPKSSNSITPKSASPAPKTSPIILFVPNDNALLNRIEVPAGSTPGGATYSQKAKTALELLFSKIDFWPKGARLLSAPVKEKDGVVRVNMSREFQSLATQSETEVRLALDAMARTLGALESKNGKPLYSAKMRVVSESKGFSAFNHFLLDEPWKANQIEPDASENSKNEDAL